SFCFSFQFGREFYLPAANAFVRSFAGDQSFAIDLLTLELREIRDFYARIEARNGFLATHLVGGFGRAMIEITRAAEINVGEEIADVHFGISEVGIQPNMPRVCRL